MVVTTLPHKLARRPALQLQPQDFPIEMHVLLEEQREISEDHHLHLRALVLEPELDLEGLQPQLPAQLLALLVVRVWAFLEEAGHETISKEKNEFCE